MTALSTEVFSAVGILSESRAFSETRFSGVETLLGAGFFSGPRVLSGSRVLSGVGVLFVEGAFAGLLWSSSCGDGRDGSQVEAGYLKVASLFPLGSFALVKHTCGNHLPAVMPSSVSDLSPDSTRNAVEKPGFRIAFSQVAVHPH